MKAKVLQSTSPQSLEGQRASEAGEVDKEKKGLHDSRRKNRTKEGGDNKSRDSSVKESRRGKLKLVCHQRVYKNIHCTCMI